MKTVKPKYVKNKLYYFIGLVFIILNYIRHSIFKYTTPRTFSIYQFERAIDYDFAVIENWITHLNKYSKLENSVKDKVILELGPGQDLGNGIILLGRGVKKYIALDVNKLDKSTPLKFYEMLLDRLKKQYPDCDTNYLKEQLERCHKDKSEKIRYIVNDNFEIPKNENRIDLVFSNASFEHFTNVEKTIREVSRQMTNGGILIAQIDLSTHTFWIRERDPLNIYRYSDWLWNYFKFKGSPNRMRTLEYKELLEKYGWFNVKIEPLAVLEEQYLAKVKPSLCKKFSCLDSLEMRMLGVMIMATRK